MMYPVLWPTISPCLNGMHVFLSKKKKLAVRVLQTDNIDTPARLKTTFDPTGLLRLRTTPKPLGFNTRSMWNIYTWVI